MAYTDIPKGQNADYYLSGRARALFRLEYPLATDPPVGTPAWWSNEGVKDAWQRLASRTGAEASLTGADGSPLPVKLGVPDPLTGVVPKGPYDNQMPGTGAPPAQGGPAPMTIRIPPWATDYWAGYLLARQDSTTAATRRAEGARWSAFYQRGLADGLAGAPPNDPSGFIPSAAQLGEVGFTLTGAPPAPFVKRPAPAYVPRNGGGGGGVYIPPPGPVLSTKEIFGVFRGRVVPVFSILTRDGMRNHVKAGGRVVVGVNSREGFGLGGIPGAWDQASGGVSPGNFGLDPQVGVVAWDGQRTRPVDAYTLGQLLGPNWRAVLQAAV